MVKLRSIICGEIIIVDIKTKRASIIGLIEAMNSHIFPFAVAFTVYTSFEGDLGENAPLQMELILNGVLIGTKDLTTNFTSTTARNVTNFGMLTITEPGELVIKIINGQDIQERKIIKISSATLPTSTQIEN